MLACALGEHLGLPSPRPKLHMSHIEALGGPEQHSKHVGWMPWTLIACAHKLRGMQWHVPHSSSWPCLALLDVGNPNLAQQALVAVAEQARLRAPAVLGRARGRGAGGLH